MAERKPIVIVDGSPQLLADADTISVALDDSTIQRYVETSATLTVDDDGDGTYSVTVPLDGRVYSVTLTQDVDIAYTIPSASDTRGSTVVHFIQDATGSRVVSFPSTTEWADATAQDVDTTASARTRAVFTQFSATGVDVDLDVRGPAV